MKTKIIILTIVTMIASIGLVKPLAAQQKDNQKTEQQIRKEKKEQEKKQKEQEKRDKKAAKGLRNDSPYY